MGGEKVYSVVVVKGEAEEVKGVVGKYRHGWVVWRRKTKRKKRRKKVYLDETK